MAHSIGSTLRGVVTLTLMVLNVIVMVGPLFVVALLKFLVPVRAWRKGLSRVLTAIAEQWIAQNNLIFRVMRALPLDVRGDDGLSSKEWYLVLSNHSSWVDILVLQAVFNRRIPFLKFFLKQQLIWVPLLGLAWWALDFPFMRRYTSEYLKKHPEMRGKDLEATRTACAKFSEMPTSVMNFVEGTRFTEVKHAAQSSPFRHLLLPRAGGTSFVLSAMGGVLHSILDVTIVYVPKGPSLWDLCCGRVRRVVVDIRKRAIEEWMSAGDYANDPAFRERFQRWLTGVWAEKDGLLAVMDA